MKWQLLVSIIAFIFISDSGGGYNWRQRRPYRPHFMGGPQYTHRYQPTGRIVGGTDTQPAEIPYQLRMTIMRYGQEHHCGAVLVSGFNAQFVLTAAHCVTDNSSRFTTTISPAKLSVVAGLHNLKSKAGTQTKIPFRVIKHEQYNDDLITYDIAILFFGSRFRTSSTVSPIELPKFQYPQPEEMEISGWGSTTQGKPSRYSKYPDILQVTVIRTLDNAECKRRFQSASGTITKKQICLLQPGVNVGTCSGDSGGPGVAIDSNGRLYLAGVASYHIGGCGNGQYPMFYTRISSYINWIRDKVNDNNG